MSVSVASQFSPYEVHIVPGALRHITKLTADTNRVAVIHTATVAHIVSRLRTLIEVPVTLIEVPDAEQAKTPQVLAQCWERLAANGFTRNDLVIGLGGGATTDLAGFVAASWLRGVGYISVPTTVLGMVDAAVGGKTGINLTAGKNLVGAFYEPKAVLCDLELLDSLPEQEVVSGLAEVIKCGFIADAEILRLAEENLAQCRDVTSARFAELVTRAVAVKAKVVATDLTERTSTADQVGREALNYGHTLGHAIEAHARYTWRHGQAISVGMAWIARVSRELLGLAEQSVQLHDQLLGALGLPLSYPASFAQLRSIMNLDKKARGAALRLVALPQLGQPVILTSPDEQVLEHCYHELSHR